MSQIFNFCFYPMFQYRELDSDVILLKSAVFYSTIKLKIVRCSLCSLTCLLTSKQHTGALATFFMKVHISSPGSDWNTKYRAKITRIAVQNYYKDRLPKVPYTLAYTYQCGSYSQRPERYYNGRFLPFSLKVCGYWEYFNRKLSSPGNIISERMQSRSPW